MTLHLLSCSNCFVCLCLFQHSHCFLVGANKSYVIATSDLWLHWGSDPCTAGMHPVRRSVRSEASWTWSVQWGCWKSWASMTLRRAWLTSSHALHPACWTPWSRWGDWWSPPVWGSCGASSWCTCDFIYASNLLPLLPTPLPYNNYNVRMHYTLINATLSAHITHWYTGLNTIFYTHVEADSPIKTIYTYDKALYGNTHTRSCTHALWHAHTVTVAETWQLILVGAERLWEEEGFQFGFKRWQGWAQTPSTGLRHPSFGGRCWKAMLGVWAEQCLRSCGSEFQMNSKCGVQSKRKCESHESCVCIVGFLACGRSVSVRRTA